MAWRRIIGTQIERMANDQQPYWLRRMRQWRFPVCYCVFVQTVGALTLLIRPWRPGITGNTYPSYDTFRECYPLAAAMLFGIAVTLFVPDEPHFCRFLFVMMTALVRGSDSLHPFSIVPLWMYIFVLIPWQFCALLELRPAVFLAGWLLAHKKDAPNDR